MHGVGAMEMNGNESYGQVSERGNDYSTTTAASPASVAGLTSENSALDLEYVYNEIRARRPPPSVAAQNNENATGDNVVYLEILHP